MSHISHIKNQCSRFAEDGVNFSLNTDDPTVTGHTLQDEFNLVMSWGLTEAHIVRAVSTNYFGYLNSKATMHYMSTDYM